MPETPWPSGYEFQLSEHSGGRGKKTTWNRGEGSKVGKFYDLKNHSVGSKKATAFRNTARDTIDNGLTGFQVLGVMKSNSSDSMPVVFNNETDSWTPLSADQYNTIHNDSVWGVIATTYPAEPTDTKPMIKHLLHRDWKFNNAASINFEDLRKAAEGNRTHKYKYLTKSGSIYDKPPGRDMCPGNPEWGFKAWTFWPSEIRCRYDITDQGQMNAIAASIQNDGQGSDDQTTGYEQIYSILKKYCLRGDNYSKDVGGTGNKLSCKHIVGDVGLLTNFCKSLSSDGEYNVIKNSGLCTYDNLESNSDGNYRDVWKEVCEKPSMRNEDECKLFWATESTLASNPEDNPGITDPCSGPEANRPPVCNATQGIVDNINEAFASGKVTVSGGITSGENRRLCYSGSGRKDSLAKYDWKNVSKDPTLCDTKIQICNTELVVGGSVNSNFDQKVLCIQSDGDDNGDPDIRNNKKPSGTGSANKSDDKGDDKGDDDDDDKSFLQKYWWILLIVVVIVMMMFLGITVVL